MEKRSPLSELQNVDQFSFGDKTPALKTSLSDNNPIYRELLAKGKAEAAQGNLKESLEAFKKAYGIKKTEKILGRIKKIEGVLAEMEDEGDKEEDFVELDNGLIIYRQLVERLYPHQIKGVKWIYDLQQKKKKGGILADDMGLGKTIQVIAALSAMFDMEVVRHVLLVLPLSLVPNWQREFERWAPGIVHRCFHGNAKEKSAALNYCQRRPSVCITTYGTVLTSWEQLGQTKFREEFVWDYIILDEGHKIKNPTKTTKGLHAIPSRNRLILTGTPMQNNLRELWALFDWIMQGTLLGTQKTFKMEYETPITRARQKGASSAEIHLGNYMSESLRRIVEPYIMRRTKASVSAPKSDKEKADECQNEYGLKNQPKFPKLERKNDFVIWTYLSDVQEKIYRDFIQQDDIKELLATKRSPLVYLTLLKKICDHPRLLTRKACYQLGLEANESLCEDDFHTEKGNECAANRIDNISDETLIQESGKLQFLIALLEMLKREGHRTLIFSLSRKVLNIIHRILLNRKFKVMRLDGTITKLKERELRVQKFQKDSSYEVFLLTTQVGGVGLTLTAADRVVIFDPSWNPATDAQAVDRIYRIGQKKNVVVYRLITCGTVEEKIYRRQIFKDSIIKQSTGDKKDPYRYFSYHELKELFQLESTTESVTQRQLQDLHGEQRCVDSKLADHLAHLHSFHMFGISDHDLMFSQDPDDVDQNMMDEHKDSLRNKVAEAQIRVEQEAKCFTGRETAESRWGEFEPRPKVYEPKVRSPDPVFPIEGLYDRLDLLLLDDNDAVASAFNETRNPVKKENEKDHESSSPSTEHNRPIEIIDHDKSTEDSIKKENEEFGVSTSNDESKLPIDIIDDDEPTKKEDIIHVDDSPVRESLMTRNLEVTEVEESFIESFNSGGTGSVKNTPSKALFEADISCIPTPACRSANRDIDTPEELTARDPAPKSYSESSRIPISEELAHIAEESMNSPSKSASHSRSSPISPKYQTDKVDQNDEPIDSPSESASHSRSNPISPKYQTDMVDQNVEPIMQKSSTRSSTSFASVSDSTQFWTPMKSDGTLVIDEDSNSSTELENLSYSDHSRGSSVLDDSGSESSTNSQKTTHDVTREHNPVPQDLRESAMSPKYGESTDNIGVQGIDNNKEDSVSCVSDKNLQEDDSHQVLSDDEPVVENRNSDEDLPDYDETLDSIPSFEKKASVKEREKSYENDIEDKDFEDLLLEDDDLRLKLDDYDIESLDGSDDDLLGGLDLEDNCVGEPVSVKDESHSANWKTADKSKIRRRSSALRSRDFSLSDDSDDENSISKPGRSSMDSAATDRSKMSALQLPALSDDEDLF